MKKGQLKFISIFCIIIALSTNIVFAEQYTKAIEATTQTVSKSTKDEIKLTLDKDGNYSAKMSFNLAKVESKDEKPANFVTTSSVITGTFNIYLKRAPIPYVNTYYLTYDVSVPGQFITSVSGTFTVRSTSFFQPTLYKNESVYVPLTGEYSYFANEVPGYFQIPSSELSVRCTASNFYVSLVSGYLQVSESDATKVCIIN